MEKNTLLAVALEQIFCLPSWPMEIVVHKTKNCGSCMWLLQQKSLPYSVRQRSKCEQTEVKSSDESYNEVQLDGNIVRQANIEVYI